MKNASPSLVSRAVLSAMLICVLAACSSWSQDAMPPTVLSAQYGDGLESVFVTFSEPMQILPALDRFNYLIAVMGFDMTPISEITQGDLDGRIFRLGLEHPANLGSELTIQNVIDMAGNTLSPNPTIIPIEPVPEPSTIAMAVLATLIVLFSTALKPTRGSRSRRRS